MRPRTAEVISIGDEMTSGARLDTNTRWITRRLGEIGIEVPFHTTVGDTLGDLAEVFRIATRRVGLVVCTGGLGPTRDDLTREALAALVGQPLELREEAYRHIESLFSSRRREMPERNRIQAMFPRGSREIFNAHGTAPGIEVSVGGDGETVCRAFALPGVPAEMKPMFDQLVVPRILHDRDAARTIRHVVMKFFGTGESEMERRLGDLIARDRQPRVGITASAATISLRITAVGDSAGDCDAMIDATRERIMSSVGEFYFGDGDEFELQHAVERDVRQRGQSLAILELGYAAPLGDWFAALGETDAYRGGLSLAGADDLCRIAATDSFAAAAEWLKSRLRADWLLTVDAYPELTQLDRPAAPASEVRFMLVPPDGSPETTSASIGGHPSIVHPRIGKAALQWFRGVLGQ